MSGRARPTSPNAGTGANAPCNATTQPCPYAPVLEGELIELTWKSGVKAAKDKKEIKAPHWKKGVDVTDGSGSTCAAVYLVESKGGSHDVELKIEITKSQGVSNPGRVLGIVGGLEIEGECPTAVGTHTVNAKIKKLPEEIAWHLGDISWRLEVASPSKSVTLGNRTRVEVFVVFDKPSDFYKKGVWVEVLRFLCDKAGVKGQKTSAEAIEKIVKYCHGGHGLRYDTSRGAPAYGCGGSGGTFRLASYLAASLKVVNCYDQAAAVQALAGALGVSAKWCFQGTPPKIFGFINTTNLIGVGTCNNPFHGNDHAKKVVPAADPSRTAFGNHAFCELDSKSLDACAGPHVGRESATEYLNASVDYAETTRRGHSAGMAADITYPSGVVEVE